MRKRGKEIRRTNGRVRREVRVGKGREKGGWRERGERKGEVNRCRTSEQEENAREIKLELVNTFHSNFYLSEIKFLIKVLIKGSII